MKKQLKIALGIIILAVTIGAFVRYVATHPQIIDKLTDTNPALLVLVILLYGVWFLAHVLQMRISLSMFKKSMPPQENVLLSAYSALINFFGPGQSGPGLRGLYLKARYQLRIKDYLFVSLIYYAFYAMLSALMLFVGSRPWWQTVLLVTIVGSGSLGFVKWYEKRSQVKEGPGLNLKNLSYLFLATVLQMAAQVGIYWSELQSVSPGVSLAQVLAYTGAANFALFVALTPGAIGIRESFLFFTGQLHHISNAAIVAANVIDRAAYLLFLGILFLLVVSLHAKDKLKLSQLKQPVEE